MSQAAHAVKKEPVYSWRSAVVAGILVARLAGSRHAVSPMSKRSSVIAANSSGSAQDASDRVIYDTTDGRLYYDADGSGAGAAQLIATAIGAPDLVASDLMVI